MEKNEATAGETSPVRSITKEPATPERPGTVICVGENQYKLIDPKTGGTYIVKTDVPWPDEKVIKHINLFVRKNGRAPATETITLEAPIK